MAWSLYFDLIQRGYQNDKIKCQSSIDWDIIIFRETICILSYQQQKWELKDTTIQTQLRFTNPETSCFMSFEWKVANARTCIQLLHSIFSFKKWAKSMRCFRCFQGITGKQRRKDVFFLPPLISEGKLRHSANMFWLVMREMRRAQFHSSQASTFCQHYMTVRPKQFTLVMAIKNAASWPAWWRRRQKPNHCV